MSLKKKAFSGLIWAFAQQFSTKGINFIVSLVLARYIAPTEFGLIGMITVFIAIGTVLFEAGLTQSLVRTQDVTQEDYSTVFFFNVVGSGIIYAIIFFIAPLISHFYNQSVLTSIIRVYCLTFVVRAFSNVQNTILTKKIDFKTQLFISLPSLIFSSIIGISMAYWGYGVWSLVWSAIISALLSTLQLWFYSEWRPTLIFSFSKFKIHFNFGYKLTISGILDTIFVNIYQIVIGKYFSSAQVGFYTRAETMKQFPVTTISGALYNVTFPLFASIQDDNERLKRAYKKIMQMVMFIIAPVIIFLGVLAEPLFRFLFTEKWLPAVPYFQIICISGLLYPIHLYNINILTAKGRSDLFLKLEIIKKIVVIPIVTIALFFGIKALIWSQVINSLIALYINTYYTGKLINYNSWQQTMDIVPILLIAIVSGAVTLGMDYILKINDQLDITRITVGGMVGVGAYIMLGFFFQKNVFKEFKLLMQKR